MAHLVNFKTGACSVILKDKLYAPHFEKRDGKLLRITKISPRHNDYKNLGMIRTIPEYSKWFAIPDKEKFELRFGAPLWNVISNTYSHDQTVQDIFKVNHTLLCSYIDNAGNQDVYDTLNALRLRNDHSVWKSFGSVWRFIEQMCSGLRVLHENKICHLDIKSENVMVSLDKKTFKLIDFGFSSREPFTDYTEHLKGTPGYFPKHFGGEAEYGFPEIFTNDMILVENQIPMKRDYRLVYKVDSYCLGRLIQLIFIHYSDNPGWFCLKSRERKNKDKIQRVLMRLLNGDVHQRATIEDLYTELLIE